MSAKISRRSFALQTAAAAAAGALAAPRNRAWADDPARWGDLAGRLVYDGTAPPRRRVVVDKDVECCGQFDIRDETLIVGGDGGLANAFVFLRSRPAAVHPDLAAGLPETVVLDNRGCSFVPHCMTLWIGVQQFEAINSDPIPENVAFAPLLDPPANLVLPPGGRASYTFRREQRKPVLIFCNYHPWESAYILPRSNPYMAITDAQGRFRIPRLPVGPHDFQVWHERTDFLATPAWPRGQFSLTIRTGENDLGEIRLPPALFAPA